MALLASVYVYFVTLVLIFSIQGMFSSRGKHLLMVDADGATRFSDLTKVQNSLNQLVDEKVGSTVLQLIIAVIKLQ